MRAGTYTVAPFAPPTEARLCLEPPQPGCTETHEGDSLRFTVTVPDGWSGLDTAVWLGENKPPSGAALGFDRGAWLLDRSVSESDDELDPGRADGRRLRRRGRAHPILDTTTLSMSRSPGTPESPSTFRLRRTSPPTTSTTPPAPSTVHGNPGSTPRARAIAGTCGSSTSMAFGSWSRAWTTRAPRRPVAPSSRRWSTRSSSCPDTHRADGINHFGPARTVPTLYGSVVNGVLALIPGYQEGPRIATVVEGARAFLPVVVVDDGSTDDTAARAEAAGATVLRQVPNAGQGRGPAGRLPVRPRARRRGRRHARRRRAARPGRDPGLPRRVRGLDARADHRPARLRVDAAGPAAVEHARWLGLLGGRRASRPGQPVRLPAHRAAG